MPVCKSCGEQVQETVRVKIQDRFKVVCEDCAELAREAAEVSEESEAVVQQMMGFKGRR